MVEYMKISALKEGDLLGRTIYDEKGGILLKDGARLSRRMIGVIEEKGYKGVYINHADQRNLVMVLEPIIDDFTSLRVIDLLGKCFTNSKLFDDPWDAEFSTCRKKLEKYISEFYDLFVEKDKQGKCIFEIEDARNIKNWYLYHSFNCMQITLAILLQLKQRYSIPADTIKEVAFAALVHDLGKAKYPDLISKRNITEEERNKLKEHPRCMFEVLQTLGAGLNSRYAVWQHHERLDGSGYPTKIKGDTITMYGQVIGLASQYDNLINVSPFNEEPLVPNEALELLMASGRFNAEYIKELTNVVAAYPIGSKVELSNGETGIVVENHKGLPLRPTLLIGYHKHDMSMEEKYRSVVITKIAE